MRKFLLAGLMLVGLVGLGGCAQPKKVVPLPEPVSASALASIKAEYQKMDATAQVGVVGAIRTDMPFIAIEGIQPTGVKRGTVVTIVAVSGDSHTPIAHGQVTMIDTDNIIAANYTPVPGAIRPPAQGDLVVVFVH